MKIIRDLDIREVVSVKSGIKKRYRFALFLCPVCGNEAERKKNDGLKQKKCCGGKSKIAAKGSDLHNRYIGMTQRCNDVNSAGYKNYGGRGIKVCKQWNNFDNFAEWAISNGFEKNKQLDRIDNSKGYSPENCRFIYPKENSWNKRSNTNSKETIEKMIEMYVTTPCTFDDIAEKFGESRGNVANILRKKNWDFETKWDKYIDRVIEVKKILPSDIRKLWAEKF